MKLFFRLVFGLLLICFTACEQGDNFVRPEGADALDDPHAVTVEAALGELNGLLAEIDPATRGGGRTVASVGTVTCGDVASPATRSGETPEGNLVHIVQFAGGGYAVLGADDRLPSIIAVVDEGELTAEAYAEMVRNGVPEDENGCPAVYPGIVFGPEIYELLGNDADVSANVIPLPKYVYEPWTTMKCDALIKTKWGQLDPYNIFTPEIDRKHAAVGCVAVAVAQIMIYKLCAYGAKICPRYIAGYEIYWDEILERLPLLLKLDNLSTYQEIYSVAMLMRAVGIAVNMDYRIKGSYAYIKDAASCLAQYGFQGVRIESYNYDTVCSMIDRTCPVFILAQDSRPGMDGHAWILDAYTFQWRNYRVVDPRTDEVLKYGRESRKLLHCNFGWSGTKDGYYVDGIFNMLDGPVATNADEVISTVIDPHNFDSEMQIITYTGYYGCDN